MPKKIRKLLIANRGEIALRVLRAAKELGLSTVAVFAGDDALLPHVMQADEAVPLPGETVQETYLNIEAILDAAKKTRADAVHPGYGFLSENAQFAACCQNEGLIFVGPSSEAIHAMGDKIEAKKRMKAAGVATIPGSDGVVGTFDQAAKVARRTGYPLLFKAVYGGGGRGMRRVDRKEDLQTAFESATREAKLAFGNGDLYMERFFERARHVEVQILCDGRGHGVHLFERECSIQRRHQKLLEESPSPALTPEQRKALCEQAIQGALSLGYASAGTLEFVLDQSGNFYFMEMNTRIQVEHPVTEEICRIDLVKWQLKIAGGEPLTLRQEEIRPHGHAIECRINAEDPFRNFAPAPGKVTGVQLPAGPGVRVDTFLYPQLQLPSRYDSLVAKLIVWGEDRKTALRRTARALADFHVQGIPTTIPFHLALLKHPKFQRGDVSTLFLQEESLDLEGPLSPEATAAVAAALNHFMQNKRGASGYLPRKWAQAARLEALG